MTRNEEAILASCERYIKDGVENKYVCEYYKKLTDIDLKQTDRTTLREEELVNDYFVKQSSIYLLIIVGCALMWTTFEGTLQKVLASLSFVMVVIVAFINTVGMKSDRIAKLLWRHYNCGNAEEWFVDFLVGKGIVEL